MKKIKDPVLFEKIRAFLTEYMPIIKRESTKHSNCVPLYSQSVSCVFTEPAF